MQNKLPVIWFTSGVRGVSQHLLKSGIGREGAAETISPYIGLVPGENERCFHEVGYFTEAHSFRLGALDGNDEECLVSFASASLYSVTSVCDTDGVVDSWSLEDEV